MTQSPTQENFSRPGPSRTLIIAQLFLVALVFIGDRYGVILFSKTPYLLFIATLSLLERPTLWTDFGWRVPPQWARILLIGIAAGVAMECLELFVTQPLLVRVTGQMPDLSDAKALASSPKLFVAALILTWSLAAIGEELVWRGWFLNTVWNLLGSSRLAVVTGLTLMSVAFGYAHADQELPGIVENTINAFLLGSLYMLTGRNLLAPMVAHGMTDTVDMTMIFTGHYPGL